MTDEEIKYLKEHNLYDNAILMANRILIHCHIMLFCLDDLAKYYPKIYRQQIKRDCNIIHNKLDKITSDGISMFKTGGVFMSTLCIDIMDDLLESIYDDNKYLYILQNVSDFAVQESFKHHPTVSSPYEDILIYTFNIFNHHFTKYTNNKNSATYRMIIKNILDKIVKETDTDGDLIIVYDNGKKS